MKNQKIGVWIFSFLLLGILIQGGMPLSYADHLQDLEDECKAKSPDLTFSVELRKCVPVEVEEEKEEVFGDKLAKMGEEGDERSQKMLAENLNIIANANTEEEKMDADVQESQTGGGCLIATATYGSELAPQVQMLRELRDNVILETQSGVAFMTVFNQMYYSFSPEIADMERENPVLQEVIKVSITPMISSLSILNHLDIDSEAEMLGYGIGVISLNIGMYFVAPAIIVVKLLNRKK